MDQPTIPSLADLHNRWGPPPPTLDAATIAYLNHGLTLERNSCSQLGLRRRQGWKMAQAVLTEVAVLLADAAPPTSTASSLPVAQPANDGNIHTPLPNRSTVTPGDILTPESLDKGRERSNSSTYLRMLTTPGLTGAEIETRPDEEKQPSPFFPSTLNATATTHGDDSDDEPSTSATTPSPPLTAKHTSHTTPAPTNHPSSSDNDDSNEERDSFPLHPLLARLNATWSDLLALDIASRCVEHRVARDLGALRRLRMAALDGMLEDLEPPLSSGSPRQLSGSGEDGGVEREGKGYGRYTAVIEALSAKLRGGEDREMAAVMGEWMSEGVRGEVEEGVGLDWEGLKEVRERVERELVEKGVLEYESE